MHNLIFDQFFLYLCSFLSYKGYYVKNFDLKKPKKIKKKSKDIQR